MNPNAPAHPSPISPSHTPGLSIRDYLATQYIAAQISNPEIDKDIQNGNYDEHRIIEVAYLLADAQIAFTEKDDAKPMQDLPS